MGWTAAAQITSNSSNFLLTILVARSVGATELGTFAALMAASGLAIGVVRAWASEPMIFRERVVDSLEAKNHHASVVAVTATIGTVIGGFLCVLVFVATKNPILAAVFGVSLPFAVTQDAVRFVLVDAGRARLAFGTELAWVAVQSSAILAIGSSAPLSGMLAAWGLGAATSVAVGVVNIGTPTEFRDLADWVRKVRRVSPVYMVDFLVAGGINQVVVFVIAATAGLEAAGYLRAAQLLLMPLTIFTLSMSFALAPEVTRAARSDNPGRLVRIPILYSSAIALIALVCVGVSDFLPIDTMSQLMGESVHGGVEVLPYAAIALAVAGISVGPGLVLRALGRVRASMVVKIVAAPVTLIAVAVAATAGGAIGSQIGLAFGTALRAAASGVLMLRATSSVRDPRRKNEAPH
ncbi:MATE family efflux transporter [Rhodococcus aetherivorans]|uniref:hypothetical protein n=1 Tax=Rhodococcus aetherivorans TaxID=191292 RepID=UPI00364F5081